MADEVEHQQERKRFVLRLEGKEAELNYSQVDGILRVHHTGVPLALQHRGLANRLAEAAVAHAREFRLKIDPQCRFMAVYLKRHPEYQSLLIKSPAT